jgi:hypothetical protein
VPLPEASSLPPPSRPRLQQPSEQSPTLPQGDPLVQIILNVPPPPVPAPPPAHDRQELRFQYRASSSRVDNTTHALARATAANDAALSAQAVAAIAAGIAPLVAPPADTRARIESLCKVGRFSSATRVCRKLDDHLKGNPPAPHPSSDALAVLIEQLHPPENDRDLLPDDSLDPPHGDIHPNQSLPIS